jgi:hypothetical protein
MSAFSGDHCESCHADERYGGATYTDRTMWCCARLHLPAGTLLCCAENSCEADGMCYCDPVDHAQELALVTADARLSDRSREVK